MSVAQEFIDLFVPIDVIRRKYPGGWEQCLRDYGAVMGKAVWHDDWLFREGAMSGADIQWLVSRWQKRGFEVHREENGRPVEWLDVCVSEKMLGGPTLTCKWIAYDPESGGAYVKGHLPGPLIGPKR